MTQVSHPILLVPVLHVHKSATLRNMRRISGRETRSDTDLVPRNEDYVLVIA